MSDTVLTEEMRAKASEKPVFNILHITNHDSRLSLFRGETILSSFSNFYFRLASVNYMVANSGKLGTMKVSDFDNINILILDNITDFVALRNITDIHQQMLNELEPKWKETIEAYGDKHEEAVKYIRQLNAKRESRLKIIYQLDELVWDAPIGRSHDIQSVQIIENYMNMSDCIIVPTAELREAITYYKLIFDESKDIFVIPTAVNYDFFPLLKDFKRDLAKPETKPKILIKGLTIPANVEEFIVENHKKMKITICTVGDLNEHINGLIQRQKIAHIHHWANPFVNYKNFLQTYALERDLAFDIVLHVKADKLENMYDLVSGDEDILFSIASGSLPITGIDHLNYDEDSSYLGKSSGLTFGKDTTAHKLKELVEAYLLPVRWNEAFIKCRNLMDSRTASSTKVLASYFGIFLGKEMSEARSILANEAKEKLESTVNEPTGMQG